MAKKIVSWQKKLKNLRYKCNLAQKIACSNEENEKYIRMLENNEPLPENVYAYPTSMDDGTKYFYLETKCNLQENEYREYIDLKKLTALNSINENIDDVIRNMQNIEIELERQTKITATIRTCVVFFTITTILGVILALFAMCAAL